MLATPERLLRASCRTSNGIRCHQRWHVLEVRQSLWTLAATCRHLQPDGQSTGLAHCSPMKHPRYIARSEMSYGRGVVEVGVEMSVSPGGRSSSVACVMVADAPAHARPAYLPTPQLGNSRSPKPLGNFKQGIFLNDRCELVHHFSFQLPSATIVVSTLTPKLYLVVAVTVLGFYSSRALVRGRRVEAGVEMERSSSIPRPSWPCWDLHDAAVQTLRCQPMASILTTTSHLPRRIA